MSWKVLWNRIGGSALRDSRAPLGIMTPARRSQRARGLAPLRESPRRQKTRGGWRRGSRFVSALPTRHELGYWLLHAACGEFLRPRCIDLACGPRRAASLSRGFAAVAFL